MDQVVANRESTSRAQACLSQLKGIGDPPQLETIERVFLDVIQNNLGDASDWIPLLKRQLQQDDLPTQAVVQRLIGRYYENRSYHRKAIKWTRRAQSSFKELGHKAGMGQCARTLFSAFAHLGDYLSARTQAETMLATPDLPDEERLKITINLGALAYRQHDYEASQKHFSSARQQLHNHENALLQAIVIYNLGNLQVVFNHFGSAEKSFAAAKQSFSGLGQKLYEAHTLQALGHLYVILGQYHKAESHLIEAKGSYNRLDDPFGAMLCDLEIIRMSLGLNHHHKVLNAMPELLREFQDYGRSAELGQLCYYGALAATNHQEPELAEMYLTDAESIFSKIDDAFFSALCNLVRAPWLAKQGRMEEAFQLMTDAREFFQKTRQSEHELACLLLISQLDEAAFTETEYQRLRRLLNQPLSPRGMVEGHILLGDYLYRKRQFKRGLRALYTAVNMIEESRASIPLARFRRSFFEDKAEIYEHLLSRLLEWGRNDKLTFRVLQLSRSRQMSEQLSRREALPPLVSMGDPTILAMQKLDLELNQLNERLEGMNRLGRPEEQVRVNLLDDLQAKKRKRLALRRRLHQEDRLGLFFPLDIEPDAITSNLQPNQLVVILLRDKNQLYRMELRKEHLRTHRVLLPANYDKQLRKMLQILRFPMMNKMDRIPELAQELSAPLIPKHRHGIDHVIYILHKSLKSFPLALLRKNHQYLIQTHFLSQCPNIAALYFTLRRGKPKLASPVFFLSDHPEDPAASERSQLQKGYPDAKIFNSFDRKDIAHKVNQSGFIHFAGHCHFNPQQPRRSYLQLNQQRYYLSQMARWRLENAAFVNFAACQSGHTAHDAGNEPSGFVVGAIGAGAACVLASHWEIEDQATGAWMTAFYSHLRGGLAHAYRQACLEIMETYPQPYYWAGFALVGRADFDQKPA